MPLPPLEGPPRAALVADDNADVRQLLALALRRLGFAVLEAGSAAEALRLVAAGGPVHLLLVDANLGTPTGRALAERLSSLAPGVRVLYTSGSEYRELVRAGLVPAGAAFLPKP